MSLKTKPQIKVANEVWLATALLHRENPSKEDFTVKEIESRAEEEGLIDEPASWGIPSHSPTLCRQPSSQPE